MTFDGAAFWAEQLAPAIDEVPSADSFWLLRKAPLHLRAVALPSGAGSGTHRQP